MVEGIFENRFPYSRSGLTTFQDVHVQKACSFPYWKRVNNREWAYCCGMGWIVAGWMMCSFAQRCKGKHMCACSIVNKLFCGIPQWPDVMDKCQTNALTLLLEQPREKLLGALLWRKQSPSYM